MKIFLVILTLLISGCEIVPLTDEQVRVLTESCEKMGGVSELRNYSVRSEFSCRRKNKQI